MTEKFTGLTEEQKRLLAADTKETIKDKKQTVLKDGFAKYGITIHYLEKHVLITFADAEKILGALQCYSVVLSKDGTTLKMIKQG